MQIMKDLYFCKLKKIFVSFREDSESTGLEISTAISSLFPSYLPGNPPTSPQLLIPWAQEFQNVHPRKSFSPKLLNFIFCPQHLGVPWEPAPRKVLNQLLTVALAQPHRLPSIGAAQPFPQTVHNLDSSETTSSSWTWPTSQLFAHTP